MTLRLASLIVVGVALGACRPPEFRFHVEHKVVADGVELIAHVNREHVELNIGVIDFSRANVDKETHVLVPWDKLPPPAGKSVEILVNARIPNVIGTEYRVYVPVSELGAHVRAAPPRETGPRTVREIVQPTEDQPVVIVAATHTAGNGAKLSGAFGAMENVEIEPLKLTFAALPDTTLEYAGTPVALDGGKGELEVSKDDLVWRTPPSYLLSPEFEPKPKLRLSFVQKRGADVREVAVLLEDVGGEMSTRLWRMFEPATRGESVTKEAKRQGGLAFIPTTGTYVKDAVYVIGAPPELQKVRFVARGAWLPRSKSSVLTCRYDRGAFVEVNYKQDLRLVAYDVATGKRLGDKVVPAKVGRCSPTTMTWGNAKHREYTITPERTEIEAAAKAWAKGG